MGNGALRAYQACRVYDREEAVVRLAEQGLRAAYFEAAIRRGHDIASRVLPVHPRTYRGQVMWAETTGEVRTQLFTTGDEWQAGYTDNYETAYNLERRMAIAVVSGNAHTGERSFEHPKTARKKGPATEKRVYRNRVGQQVFELPEFQDEPPADDEQCELWFLLMNARNNCMYSELSLPLAMGANLRIAEWRERIILPPILLTGIVVSPIEPDLDTPPEIHVGRKSL